MTQSRLSFVSLSLATLLLLDSVSWAQTTYGNIRGEVKDSAGASIVGAKVTLLEESTGVSRSTLTSSAGEYVFANINPDTYTVMVEQPGFKKIERKGLIVGTQQSITVDIKLEVGDVTQSVMVTEESPLLETASASQGQVVDRQKLIDLPNLGRNPFMMSRLSPTVAQVGNPAYNRMQDQSGSSQITINGGPVRGNNYLVDGIPITDFANRAVIIPSLEAVEEVKVQYSTYDAEMGRTGGGMFNTLLKSGGNSYHGSLTGYIRNSDWMGNNYFNNRSGIARPEQPNRTYAGSFGGKVWIPKIYDGKNRTFFWLGFEGYRDTQGASLDAYTPTAAERIGDFSGRSNIIYDPLTTTAAGTRTPFAGNIIPSSRIDPVGRAIAATYVLPTRVVSTYGSANVTSASTLPSKADQKFIKLDHTVFSWWRASLSYMKYNSSEPGENNFKNISSPSQWFLGRIVNATAWNNTITPNATTVISVRYGFNRFPNLGTQVSQGFNLAAIGFANSFVKDVPSPTFPNISMNSAYSLGTNNNFNYVHHSKNLGAQLSKFIGKHTIKGGFDYRRLHADGLDFGNSAGAFTFDNTFSKSNTSGNVGGVDMADLLLGTPNSAVGFIPTKLYQYVDYYGLFLQDDYRISKTLTVNLGLRWERESGLKETNNNLITSFDPKATNPIQTTSGYTSPGVFLFSGVNGAPTETSNYKQNKFSPRIGIAYQWNPKTTIRAGYGIFWAPAFGLGSPFNSEGITAQTQPNANVAGIPQVVLSNPFPNGLDKPVGNSLGGLTGIGKSVNVYAPNATSGMVQQFSFDVQREIGFGAVLTAGYSGSRSSDLTFNAATLNMNQLHPSNYGLGATALRTAVANPYYLKGGANGVAGATVERQQLLRPYPQFTAVNYLNNSYVQAQYDAFTVKLQKRYSYGLNFLTAYTYSKNMDNAGGGAGNNQNAGNAGPQNVYNLDAEWGLSYANAPQRLTNSVTYELPIGKGRSYLSSANYATNLLLGGWSMNAVSTFSSGFPTQFYMNNNLNSPYGNARQRPNATGVNPGASGSFAQRIDGWYNPAAFTAPAALEFGNVTRTVGLRGPGQVNWDMSIFKNFAITEGFKAQFRAEALNATNTPLFRAPNSAVGNGSFGKITQQANFPRMFQLGLRLFF
ncbi:TonB-dependent receptor [Bryobacter aggregatus]|uniref:TonB-dependent receptor n=1 Tax=Bryobacter aggregatus TaxID=360054 RepID=UPI0004E0B385|nr:TonB-dependent receptor [Bryobacter aggregatus]